MAVLRSAAWLVPTVLSPTSCERRSALPQRSEGGGKVAWFFTSSSPMETTLLSPPSHPHHAPHLLRTWVTFHLFLSIYSTGEFYTGEDARQSVQFSRSVVSDSWRPHRLQHTRLPCPSPTPGVYSNSCPSSQWCHPTISSSVVRVKMHMVHGKKKKCILKQQWEVIFMSYNQELQRKITSSVNM